MNANLHPGDGPYPIEIGNRGETNYWLHIGDFSDAQVTVFFRSRADLEDFTRRLHDAVFPAADAEAVPDYRRKAGVA